MIESTRSYGSDYFSIARRLVRGAIERPKPDAERLPEFADARRTEIEEELFSPAPISADFEKTKLAWSLTKMRERLGADHPFVKRALGKESPRQLAERLVEGTTLANVEVRRALWNGGQDAILRSSDPFIRFALATDPAARAARKRYEDQVDAVETKNGELIAQARFAQFGPGAYPDATFTLRLSYGEVRGWVEAGVPVAPFTQVGGAFDRQTGAEPFELPGVLLNLAFTPRAHHRVGQRGRDRRRDADQEHREEHQPHERQHAADDLAERDVGRRCS